MKKISENLHNLKKQPKNEYYTLYKTIEDELIHFKNELENKIIYCNCDNPNFSNFYKFFEKEIINYKIKEVIFTFYNEEKNTIKTTLKVINNKIIKEEKELINNNGDFQNKENIEILKYCDILITNPPFSLFRKLYNLLLENNKKFIIIGPFLFLINNNKNFNNFITKKLFISNSIQKFKINKINDELLIKDDIKTVNCLFYNNIKNTRNFKKINFINDYNIDNYDFIDNENIKNINSIKKIPNIKNQYFYVPTNILLFDNYNFELISINKQLKINNKFLFGRIKIKIL